MERIPSNSIFSPASTARGPAEQGEKAGSSDTSHAGESRFESVLKSTGGCRENPARSRLSAQGGRRAAIAGKEDKTDACTPPPFSAAAWDSVAPSAPDDSRPGAGVAVSEPEDAGSAKSDPVPVPAGAATVPSAAGPSLEQLSSGIHTVAAGGAEGGEENAAPAEVPKAAGAGAGAVPAPPTATTSDPQDAGSTKSGPVPVLAGAATLPSAEGPSPKQLSSGIHPAATGGEEGAGSTQAPGTGGPVILSAPLTAPASEPKDAGSMKIDGPPMRHGISDPAPGGARDTVGTRKRRADATVWNEGQGEPVAAPAVDGNRGGAERPATPRPVGLASDPGVIRLEEKAFVITRKSDTSVEVTLAPPGVGKLEIEVVLEKGVVNARITAADSAGREAIARSLPQIVEALARDGMNIGGFTVSLKERRERMGDAPAHGASRDPDARLPSAVPPAGSTPAASAGLVDIFI